MKELTGQPIRTSLQRHLDLSKRSILTNAAYTCTLDENDTCGRTQVRANHLGRTSRQTSRAEVNSSGSYDCTARRDTATRSNQFRYRHLRPTLRRQKRPLGLNLKADRLARAFL